MEGKFNKILYNIRNFYIIGNCSQKLKLDASDILSPLETCDSDTLSLLGTCASSTLNPYEHIFLLATKHCIVHCGTMKKLS